MCAVLTLGLCRRRCCCLCALASAAEQLYSGLEASWFCSFIYAFFFLLLFYLVVFLALCHHFKTCDCDPEAKAVHTSPSL